MTPPQSEHFWRLSLKSATMSQPIGPRIMPQPNPSTIRPRHLPINAPTKPQTIIQINRSMKNCTISKSSLIVFVVLWPNVAEPPPTRDVNRDSGTESANGGWLVRPHGGFNTVKFRRKLDTSAVESGVILATL